MVKATWAVACLLAVLLAAGCSNKQTVKPDGAGSAPATSGDSAAPVRETGEAGGPPIKETPVLEASAPPATVPPPDASKKAAEAATSVQPSMAGPQYKLGPEDVIKVSVWENAQLTLDLVVRPDGKISMPLIQDVVAEGQTATELAETIQKRLLNFIRDPQVSVIVLQVNAPKYFVIGNVVKPGTYSLRSDTSILQALALAGGFTQFASPRSIKLIRNSAGKQEVRKINYYNLIDEDGKGNYLLRSGDTVVVP
ncbi:polysaccharide biosynthesis/export family protein [Candidatus Deferrimicrobium sp.]|uniref:polysaccharide biosynthesis/export family protein n=1 Tax=Candidatus Deferrimicrobium sp. TaxID=3060586 RepID=UPI002ED50DF1